MKFIAKNRVSGEDMYAMDGNVYHKNADGHFIKQDPIPDFVTQVYDEIKSGNAAMLDYSS